MNPLASRKKLLIAESELNRAQLVAEWQTMSGEVHALAQQVKTISSIASVAAALLAGISLLRRKKSAPATEKTSWLKTLVEGAGVVGTLWSVFRPRPKP